MDRYGNDEGSKNFWTKQGYVVSVKDLAKDKKNDGSASGLRRWFSQTPIVRTHASY